MKLTQIAMLVCALGTTQASATIVNALNLQSGDLANDLPLVDNAGNPLTQAYVRVGSYAPDKSFADAPMILDGFRQLGTSQGSLDMSTTAPGEGIFNGDNFVFQEDSTNTGDLTGGGVPIYVVISSTSDFSLTGEFAIWRANAEFLADAAGIEGDSTALVQIGQGTLVFGDMVTGPTIAIGGADRAFQNGIELAAIPEPSAALLSLVGLGFIARRRR